MSAGLGVRLPDQVAEAIEAGVDAVLLDNMTIDQLRAAVEMIGGRVVAEASVGITPDTALVGLDL